jgi:hypothetical protein
MFGRTRIALAAVVAVAAAAIAIVSVAAADPSLSDVAAHRHFVETENGLVEVGPRLCDKPSLQSAFNQFHANTHTHNGVTGEIGPVAPGLHNGRQTELVFRACSFVP